MKPQRVDRSTAGDADTSLGALLGLVVDRPGGCPCAFPEEPPAGGDGDPFKARLRLSVERTGRSGKTVTRLTGLPAGEETDQLARRLKRSLGCGAAFEGGDLVVQGDHRKRLRELLAEWGARDVK